MTTELKVKDPEVTQAAEQLIHIDNAVRPDVDIHYTDDAFIFLVDLPGVQTGDVQIEINEHNHLLLKARNRFVAEGEPLFRQSRFANYYRAFTLNDEMDRSRIEAKLENGLLELRIAKREEVKPRRIEIQV